MPNFNSIEEHRILDTVYFELLLILTYTSHEYTVARYLFTRRPLFRLGCDEQLEHMIKVIGKMVWNSLVCAFEHRLVEQVHVCCCERHFPCNCLIQYTTERPDIALGAVRFVFPHFRTGVERGTCLGVVHALPVTHFWHIHIANLDMAFGTYKNVGRFQIAVHNFELV